jgi:hypothetical protein
MWVVTLGVVVMAAVFVRMPLKRALQGKVMRSADYLLWTSWGDEVDQYKGDENTYTKSISNQHQRTVVRDKRDKTVEFKADTPDKNKDQTVSASVEDGSEALLKTIDLNKVLK